MARSGNRKRSSHVSRSIRLRKYEEAYEDCIKKTRILKKSSRKSPTKKPKTRKSSKKPTNSPSNSPKKPVKRPLNSYQKFVQTESQKTKYQGMDAKTRMRSISNAWKNK